MLPARLRVAWHHSRIDRDLAAGVDPHASEEHALRAQQLVEPHRRALLARSLRCAVASASARRRAGVPVCRAAVLEAQPALLALADDLAEVPAPRARGVALAVQLLTNGCSPLYRPWGTDELYFAAEEARHAL